MTTFFFGKLNDNVYTKSSLDLIFLDLSIPLRLILYAKYSHFDNKISYCFGLAMKEKTTFEFRMKGKEGKTVNVTVEERERQIARVQRLF